MVCITQGTNKLQIAMTLRNWTYEYKLYVQQTTEWHNAFLAAEFNGFLLLCYGIWVGILEEGMGWGKGRYMAAAHIKR